MKSLLSFKRTWLFLLLPLSLAVSYVAYRQPALAEWYAVTIYPIFSLGENRITSLVPFSIMELLLAALAILLPALLIRLIVRLVRRKQERNMLFLRALASLLCAAGVVTFWFMISCGINYSRYPFAQVSGLTVRPSSTEELKKLCTELAQQANRDRAGIETDSQGVAVLSDRKKAAETARAVMDSMEARYPTLKSGYGAPKAVMASRLMSYLDITGVYFPFTMEANVNVDAPAYGIPATMLHELSHVRGYMREDEANFIAYLAGRDSTSPVFAYSGTILAFIYANNALYSADQKAGQETYSQLDSGAQKDLAAAGAYWKQFEGPAAKVAAKVNDSYLKSNRQEDGVKSYGRMVDLLLADYRQRHGLK
ncbi:DUF3810 domain-containing protein [Faecalispora anaeroviscerum]|uniref:DUF3810 domain-containing protein n=1 Tax=Faecalispora anaeroviscerum TaxID=2991836 RepID=UPI0024B893A6|nr:DUF3810 domain-containing protein [Faecalispora anaeroviscerum]